MKNLLIFLLFPLFLSAQVDLLLASQEQYRNETPANPIIAIGNLEAWWDRDGIDPSATVGGNNVNTWTDIIADRVLNKVTGTQPTLEINGGKREVRFNGTNAMSIAEWAAVDFVPRTNAFTIVVKIGATVSSTGTFVGKTQNGSLSMQYQLTYNHIANGQIGHNIGSDATSYFGRADKSGGVSGNKVVAVAVGTANNFDTQIYYDTEALPYSFTSRPTSPNGETIGPETIVNNHPIFIGARRNDSDTSIGFAFNGTIAHVLIFSKKLSAGEISIIVSNLD